MSISEKCTVDIKKKKKGNLLGSISRVEMTRLLAGRVSQGRNVSSLCALEKVEKEIFRIYHCIPRGIQLAET